MPLNIRSREVDELAGRLARRLGTTKTEAVRRALANEIERAEPKVKLAERIRDIQERAAARGRTGLEADKAFYDSLNDE
jgi:antitoxin VapB